MKGLLIILILFMMAGGASAATVELSFSSLNSAGLGAMTVAYTGASNSTIYINSTEDVVWIGTPLSGNGFESPTTYWSCNMVYTAEMYTGGSLVATDSIQRTDANCNIPEISFSQESYSCDATVQVNHVYAQNSTINLRSADNYAAILWSTTNTNGSGALYPTYNFTPGFSYIIDIQSSGGATSDLDTMSIQLCGGGDGGGGADDGTSTGGGGGGDGTDAGGSDGGTDPFTPPNSYDPTVPGQEWKTWIDLNGDRVTSYAETMAAFRFWGYTFLCGSFFLAFMKFGMGFKL